MKNKINAYFPSNGETLKDKKVHAVSYLYNDIQTLCGFITDELDCGYDYKKNLTKSHVTCKQCIEQLEETHKFKKENGKWK